MGRKGHTILQARTGTVPGMACIKYILRYTIKWWANTIKGWVHIIRR